MASSTKSRKSSATDCIQIRGARTNNLRNVDVDIPRDQFVVITGRSGSGKSSLAMGTLFAEGQRQYIESLSNYARQFFKQGLKAEVDSIDGLQPTLSLQQHVGQANPRSTVGTITEIYDFLRVLMARAGDIHCFQCDEMIRQQTAEEIRDSILNMATETKLMIVAPMVVDRKGKHEDVFQQIRNERLVRVRIDGEVHDIDRLPEIDPNKKHTIEAVADRIIIRENIGARLIEAIDLCVRLSDGLVSVVSKSPSANGDWEEKSFSTLYACPNCDISYTEVQPRTFSFNSPYGACQACHGLGHSVQFDPGALIPDRSLAIEDGAIAVWNSLPKAKQKKQFVGLEPIMSKLGFELSSPLSEPSVEQFKSFLENFEKEAPGLFAIIEKELATTTDEDRIDVLTDFQTELTCGTCQGARLNEQALAIRIGDKNIGDLTAMSLESAASYFLTLKFDPDRMPVAEPLLREINHRLKFLNEVGVGYLTLNRAGDTLSGGEYQRVRLASSIGSGLTNVCYVLDEPSIGLHARDNDRLIQSIRNLQQAGNSMVVVEHDEAMIRAADYVIDMGPGAGRDGGRLIAQGTPDEILDVGESLTAQYLTGSRTIDVPDERTTFDKNVSINIAGAAGNNLCEVDVEIPVGLFTCVTGVSGSGKSTLINQTLAPAIKRHLGLVSPTPAKFQSLHGLDQIDAMIVVDQKPIGRTPRGCPGTYTGVFEEIRKVFANSKDSKQLGFQASRFSFNSKSGQCPSCTGLGLQKVKMNFLPDLFVTCESCGGKRFNPQTLQVRYRDMTIADVLEMPIRDAVKQFENFSKIHSILKSMDELGLGYLPLGQPSTTLSGGEAQRIKLATELARSTTGRTLYLLDEPTTGLHFEDIRSLIGILKRIVELGNTMVVIEHNIDVIKSADWVIDMGPDGGAGGGEIVACGTPEDVSRNPASATGTFLAEALKT